MASPGSQSRRGGKQERYILQSLLSTSHTWSNRDEARVVNECVS